MTFYASLMYKDVTSTPDVSNSKSHLWEPTSITVGPTGFTINKVSSTLYNPLFYNSDNITLPFQASSWTGNYANYVIVNNGSSNWNLTLPLGPGGGTGTYSSKTMHITIKKTGSGTLTLSTPVDTVGTRIRGINTTSNKSYVMSSNTEQTITLLYVSGLDSTGATSTTSEIWFVIS